ncbi:hypothetical protein EZV62_026442 [Acer yangbiense]|uniref:Gnk2-homologous domain-containing protein n=1 Tax=Acer yangbiense TaxID=1000413 RepID=A0A5C7GR42_9ROSI|nr:hypothetical protein EZV62_026442 [Acer yangbiense]
MYGLLQCTQDLYDTDCRECLSNAIANLPTEAIGGRLLLPSYYCRYELYKFYNENLTALPPATPALSPPSTVSKPKEKTQISSSTIIAIVAPITVAAVLFFAVYCFLTRRARKKNITTEDEIGKFENYFVIKFEQSFMSLGRIWMVSYISYLQLSFLNISQRRRWK